jgi:hypothetical protein
VTPDGFVVASRHVRNDLFELYRCPSKDDTLAVFLNRHFVQAPKKFPDGAADAFAMVEDAVPDGDRARLAVAILAGIRLHGCASRSAERNPCFRECMPASSVR